MSRILLVEDETAIADTLVYALGSEGFAVSACTLGQTALARLAEAPHDLAILDVGLPDINGFDLFRALRGSPGGQELPVIFLTARGGEIDRIVGLEIGADDYITKPFSPREVVARVRTVLRRLQRGAALPSASSPSSCPSPSLTAPDAAGAAPGCCPSFRVDAPARRVYYRGVLLDLTRYEYELLITLLGQPERVFTREQLMQAGWTAPDHSLERTVDTHVKTLRAKLRGVHPEGEPIRTHRGIGYSIERA